MDEQGRKGMSYFQSNDTNMCEPSYRTVMGVLTVFPMLQILVNAVPLLAIFCYRRKLSQLNSIYIYVKSTLLANIVFGVSAFYTFLNFAIVFERPGGHRARTNNNWYNKTDPVHNAIMGWWTFRKSFTLSMVFVMLCSVVGLIYGLKQRTFLTNFPQGELNAWNSSGSLTFRNIFGSTSNIKRYTPNRKTLFRKSQAHIIVVLSWMVPISYSLLATFKWNCVDTCKCLPATYERINCLASPLTGSQWCSQQWHPVSGHYIVLFLVTWLALVGFLCVVIARSVRTYMRNADFARNFQFSLGNAVATIPIRRMVPRDMTIHRTAFRAPEFLNTSRSKTNDFVVDSSDSLPRPRLSTIVEEPNTETISIPSFPNDRSQTFSSINSSNEQSPSSLSPSLKLVVILSASVILCTLPFAVVFILDLNNPNSHWLNTIIFLLCYINISVYVLSCPLFLVKYLSDLKLATNNLLLRFASCGR